MRIVTPKRKAEFDREREAMAARERQEAVKQREEAEELLFRKWTSSNEKHKFEAKFLKFEDGKVYLQKRDGSEVAVSPSTLSKDDRRYYREFVKRGKDPRYDVFRALNTK